MYLISKNLKYKKNRKLIRNVCDNLFTCLIFIHCLFIHEKNKSNRNFNKNNKQQKKKKKKKNKKEISLFFLKINVKLFYALQQLKQKDVTKSATSSSFFFR